MATHVDAQNALLTALNAQCAGAYSLGTPKGSWDGEVRVLHLSTDAVDVVAAVIASVDARGCTIEVSGLAAESSASEPAAEIAPEPAAPVTRRGGRRKNY